MEHIYNTEQFRLENTAVCLGKFDGIHIGHRLLIRHVMECKKQGLKAAVFTFALHPSTLFSKTEAKLIDTTNEKAEKLSELGIDVLVSYPFTKETAGMSAEQFIEKVLVEKMGAKVIVVGKDFHFGHQRKGNVEMLQQYALKYGYRVLALDKIQEEEQVVSSTRVREEIIAGNMEKVTKLLEKPYAITGEVLHGKKLGRTIGMPTINQEVSDNKILPPKGVYVSKVYLEDGVHGGITNVGTKPTVSGENKVWIETHIFGFDGDLYGKVLKTELLYHVRGERKFESFDALTEQMHRDKEFGKKYLEERKCKKNLFTF